MNKNDISELVNLGFTIRKIGLYLGKSPTTVRYWLKKYGIQTKSINAHKKHSIIWNSMSDEEFRILVKSSNSISECLQAIGVNVMPANYRSFNRRCLKIGIKPTQHEYKYRRKPEENPFIEKSVTRRERVKQIVIKENLIPYMCQVCNLTPIWNGKKLSLTLDHKNGVRDDNRLMNLRFVCPNCDRQLPTYCYRNRKDIDV